MAYLPAIPFQLPDLVFIHEFKVPKYQECREEYMEPVGFTFWACHAFPQFR